MTKAQKLGITKFPYIERDLFDRETYWEHVDGYWHKVEYDSKGNLICWKNSENLGYVRKFDDNNKLIYSIDIQTWKQIQHRNSVIDKLF
jgi:hypothetical protein